MIYNTTTKWRAHNPAAIQRPSTQIFIFSSLWLLLYSSQQASLQHIRRIHGNGNVVWCSGLIPLLTIQHRATQTHSRSPQTNTRWTNYASNENFALGGGTKSYGLLPCSVFTLSPFVLVFLMLIFLNFSFERRSIEWVCVSLGGGLSLCDWMRAGVSLSLSLSRFVGFVALRFLPRLSFFALP